MKKLYFLFLLMLLPLMASAQVKRTINVETAGTLPSLISEEEKYTIEELTLTGKLNGTDFRLLRDMAGCNYLGNETNGNLKVLDISAIELVVGGENYVETNHLPDISGQFSYTVDKNYELPQCLFAGCKIADIKLPTSITEIGTFAFLNCYDLLSINIPEGVFSIGQFAFDGCKSLSTLVFPSSIKSISSDALFRCSSLNNYHVDANNNFFCSISGVLFNKDQTSLLSYPIGREDTKYTIPKSVISIGEGAFAYSQYLVEVVIPNSVTSIGGNAFSECKNLANVVIPNSVISIGYSAFSKCYNLSSITIPNSVTTIQDNAFHSCHGLTSINIPSSVTFIGNAVFRVSSNLSEIIVDPENPSYCSVSGVLFDKDMNSLVCFPAGSSITEYVIPDGIKNLEYSAFYACQKLTSISLPNSLSDIGVYAFEACQHLEKVYSYIEEPFELNEYSFCTDAFNNAVLYVPMGSKAKYQAKAHWTKFATIEELPASYNGIYFKLKDNEAEIVAGQVKYAGDIVIPNNIEYQGVSYPVTSIGEEAFSWCSGLTSVTIPNSVTSIGENAFMSCNSLTSIFVESGNAVYDSRDNCNAIIETQSNTLILGCKNTIIPNGVTSIGDYAFYGCGLTSVTIPNSVTSIGIYAFWGCTGLTSINIPNSVTSIGALAFKYCNKLTSVTIPNSVTSISNDLFSGCSKLTSVTIPNSVTSIGTCAFESCVSLKDVYCYAENVPETRANAFTYCNFDNMSLHVPTGSIEAYKSTEPWNQFKEIKAIEDPDEFSLNFMGQTIKDGATLLINAEGWSGLGSIYTDTGDNTKNGLFIFISKGGKVSGNYSLEIISNTLNGDLKWSMGGETYALTAVTKLEKTFSTDENGIASVKFSAENIPSEGSLTARLTVTIGEKTKTFNLKVDFKKKESPDLTVSGKVGEPVDLGLSVKWASWNVGAGAPEEYGNHYAWGELEPKTDYSASTYKFYSNGYTKYGSVDKKYELDEADDVARQKWGKDWRMPTFSELKELYEKCSFSQEVLNGIPVTKVTGPNGNYIYMPGPGNFTGQTLYFKDNVGSYWSRNLETDSYAKDLDFFTGSRSLNGDTRYHGQSVRPVYAGETSNIRTIHVAQAGTLPTLISDEEKYTIEELALTGELNGTDFRLLRDMAGNNYKGEETEGKLRRLDISGARIVAGGDMHIDTDHYRNGNASGSGPFHFSVDASDELPSGAFLACKLESVIFPQTITKINQNAFMTCVNLTSINIPASVTTIGSAAFYNCGNLSSLFIPYSVNSIQNQAFEGCSGLTSIIVDGGNPIYDSRNNCNAIIKTADNTLISGCSNTIIPNTVSTIGPNAFLSCNALKSISIPNSVTSIDYSAFSRCGLTSIKIPYSVTSIKQGAFSSCSDLTSITVEDGNRAYDSRDNCNAIIETSTNTLIIGCNKTVIPNTVTSIGHSAFINCQILSSVTIPDGVTAIGDYAFSGCSQLSSITIPNSVTSIGRAAFQSCRNLSSATLSDKLTSIGDWIFNGCRNLNSIEIPQNVTSIGECALQNCSALTNVTCYAATPPTVDVKAFSKTSIEDITLYVLSNCVEAYKATEPWNQFKEIKAIEPYVEPSSIIETPLTFEAVEGTVTVDIRNYFCSYMPTIQYRIDGGTWTNFSLSNNECNGTQRFSNYLPAGKIVQVRGNLPSGHFWEGDGFDIDCLEDCYVYGNVMSLFNGESFADNSDICETNMGGLFHDNIHLKNHPDKDIILPATTLYNSCYMGMFKGCTGLTRAPKLPATTLAESCYAGMFKDCTGLIEAPELPATKLEKWCYHMMFEGCTSLKTIKCLATDNIVEGDHNIGMAFWKNGDDNGTVTDWLKDAGTNVSGTKTFIVNENLSITGNDPTTATVENWGERSVSGIPEGWTIGNLLNNTETITITAAKQSTYCSDKNLDFSNKPELKAYVATGYDKSTGTIWLTRVKDVPANTGFLLMGDAGSYDIPVKGGVSDSYYENLFKGTLSSMTLQATDGANTNYYLSNGTYGIGFYKVTQEGGVALGSNRAYLSVPTDIPSVGTAGGTETINVGSALQMTYCSSNSLDFTDLADVKAYTATGYNYNSGTIWLTRVKKVPAGTGILIMAPQGSYSIPKSSVASVYANMFLGTLSGKTIQTEETISGVDYINYYLSDGDYGVGFYKVTKAGGVSIGANRSYLPIPKRTAAAGTRGISSNTDRYDVREAEDVIAIRLFNGEDGAKGFELIENAASKMEKDVFYNLQGQRVMNPGKGLYIKNGKKVLIK